MMTVPMDNSSAPLARELAQRLYNKNIELENGLRKSAQSKIRSDPNAWLQMRENYEAIILEDHDFSEAHEIEYALWQLHYRRIEEFRAHINAILTSARSITSQNGKGFARPDRIKKNRSAFKSFLSEATGFYHDLILKIGAKYGLPLGYFSEGTGNQIVLTKDGKKSAEMKKGLMSCHRCLIYLGDLARYKESYGDGDPATRDYAAASSYYIQAASLWPPSGNPHHQLAILASYSGDDLLAVYRYFRSLAVDSPFSTARDNLIIAFEKNRQNYSQLPGDAKVSSVKTVPVRMNGRGRGRGETRLLAKDIKTEATPVKGEELSIPETYKAFCVRFVRLNGILFTRTSLETFGEIFSSVISDLNKLLSSGPEEELNFGSNATENGLLVLRLIAVLIFTVHNVNKETEGQSYAEILQRSALLQNAFTAAFEFMSHILKRCIQLHDVSSSYLLPAILIFIEWLACCPNIAAGCDVEEKQAIARSFFWNQCMYFLNKLISSGFVSVDDDEDETCFSDMLKYDEGETGNRLALWEDFELRGFLPLIPAQLILDFSRKHSDSRNEKLGRMQRILAAGRALMKMVQLDQQGIYFDQKLKRFAVGTKPQMSEDSMPTELLDVSKSIGIEQGKPNEKTINLAVMQLNEQLYMEEEEEDEVIVFKPTIAEKHADMSALKANAYEVLKSVDNSSEGGWASSIGAHSTPHSNLHIQSATSSGPPAATPSIIPEPLHDINLTASKWLLEQAYFGDGLKNLSISGNGLVPKTEQEEVLRMSQLPAFSLPLSLTTNLSNGGMLPSQMKVSDNTVPSKFDTIVPSGANNDGLHLKPSASLTSSGKNPVSRPVRHLGPPPGFSPIPPKPLDDPMVSSVMKNENPPLDDYSWLDGYQMPSTEGMGPYNSLNQKAHMYPHISGNSNSLTDTLSFPFPGKQIPTVQSHVEKQKMWQDYQLPEHLRLYREQERQRLELGNQQAAPLPEQYQGQSLWSSRFLV